MASPKAQAAEVRTGEKASVLAMPAQVTASAEDAVMEAYDRASRGGIPCAVLDFTPVEFLNSSGASLLVRLYVRARRDRRRLMAFGLGDHYGDVFKLTQLDQAIAVHQSESEALSAAGEPPGGQLRAASAARDAATSPAPTGRATPRDAACWARPVPKLKVPDMPPDAVSLNVEGRRAVGPVKGFGQLWQKTYRLRLAGATLTPEEAIRVLKENFPAFQPPENRFYPSAVGIAPGEVVLINSSTPGGPVYTGVMVMYADDVSFTLITPQGHPESGWVTFAAFEEDGGTVQQIQGLARANDPIYEVALRLIGAKFQERIWRHVLTSMAKHVGVEAPVEVQKTCFGPELQWSQMGNVWYNAQVRSMLYTAAAPLRRARNLGGR